jgi:alpha-D-ribose 1-methylphosphonate 5-triphosphate synthase subunit PhnL
MNILEIEKLSKKFVLHLRGGLNLPILRHIQLSVAAGECVALVGASGSGKSSLLRTIYGNYRAESGAIRLRNGLSMVDILQSSPREIIALRRQVMAYASQFLRVIPRVSTLELVAQPLTDQGIDTQTAMKRATEILLELNLPQHLHALPPATFSGGEQQRVNLARAFVGQHPKILLDEPTASLDGRNATAVKNKILQAKKTGRAVLAAFHDPDFIAQVADRQYSIPSFSEPVP